MVTNFYENVHSMTNFSPIYVPMIIIISAGRKNCRLLKGIEPAFSVCRKDAPSIKVQEPDCLRP